MQRKSFCSVWGTVSYHPMKYYFHIVGHEKLQIDRFGETFINPSNMKDHARFLAKDLSGAGLRGYTLVVTKEDGFIVDRLEITP